MLRPSRSISASAAVASASTSPTTASGIDRHPGDRRADSTTCASEPPRWEECSPSNTAPRAAPSRHGTSLSTPDQRRPAGTLGRMALRRACSPRHRECRECAILQRSNRRHASARSTRRRLRRVERRRSDNRVGSRRGRRQGGLAAHRVIRGPRARRRHRTHPAQRHPRELRGGRRSRRRRRVDVRRHDRAGSDAALLTGRPEGVHVLWSSCAATPASRCSGSWSASTTSPGPKLPSIGPLTRRVSTSPNWLWSTPGSDEDGPSASIRSNDLARSDARCVVDLAVRRCNQRSGRRARGELIEGDAATVLAAASRNADLIVVGSRGSSGFRTMLFGSVTLLLVECAVCPVAVIPPQLRSPNADPRLKPDPERSTRVSRPSAGSSAGPMIKS